MKKQLALALSCALMIPATCSAQWIHDTLVAPAGNWILNNKVTTCFAVGLIGYILRNERQKSADKNQQEKEQKASKDELAVVNKKLTELESQNKELKDAQNITSHTIVLYKEAFEKSKEMLIEFEKNHASLKDLYKASCKIEEDIKAASNWQQKIALNSENIGILFNSHNKLVKTAETATTENSAAIENLTKCVTDFVTLQEKIASGKPAWQLKEDFESIKKRLKQQTLIHLTQSKN